MPTDQLHVELEADSARGARIVAVGPLQASTVSRLYEESQRLLGGTPTTQIEVDLRGVTSVDSSAVATLSVLARDCKRAGVQLVLANVPQPLRGIARLLPRQTTLAPAEAGVTNAFEGLGARAIEAWRELNTFIDTVAEAAGAAAGMLRGRWPPRDSVTLQSLRMGVDALPIVSLLSLLLGLVLAFQAADQLKPFGADIYVANLVGIGMFREFGPILTGVVIAGRSGSAMAAELGTMRVNEEIDALRVMGIDASRFLVLPRLLGITFMQPALTLVSNIVGCLGGLLIATQYLDVPGDAYVDQLTAAVRTGDLVHGLAKSVIFAGLIGVISCHCGLSTRGGAAAVGGATTRAVVASIFMVIVADSIFTTLATLLA